MSEETRISWSGWSDETVRIPGAGIGTPLPLQVQGGFSSHFSFQPVRSGAHDNHLSIELVTTHGRTPCRVVLPGDYDSLGIRRLRVRDGAGGFHRWHAQLVDPNSLPELPSQTARGKGTETFGYFEAAPYYEYVRVLHYEFEDHGTVAYCPATGGDPVRALASDARRKGVLRLPRHGYVTVSSDGKWEVSTK